MSVFDRFRSTSIRNWYSAAGRIAMSVETMKGGRFVLILKGISELGSGLIDPAYDCRGDAYWGEAGVGASVVLCRDAAPVLETCEHVLDAIALAIDDFVVWEWNLPAAA